MRDTELHNKVLGITVPWIATKVELDLRKRMVTIAVN
jgi:hypothetical protein